MLLLYINADAINISAGDMSSSLVVLESLTFNTASLCLQGMTEFIDFQGKEGHHIPLQLIFILLCVVPERGFWHNNLLSHLLFLSPFYQHLSGRDTCCLCFVWHDCSGVSSNEATIPRGKHFTLIGCLALRLAHQHFMNYKHFKFDLHFIFNMISKRPEIPLHDKSPIGVWVAFVAIQGNQMHGIILEWPW